MMIVVPGCFWMCCSDWTWKHQGGFLVLCLFDLYKLLSCYRGPV